MSANQVTVLGVPKHAKDVLRESMQLFDWLGTPSSCSPSRFSFIAEAVGEDTTGAHIWTVSDEPSEVYL